MKLPCAILLAVVGVVAAESTNSTYIERYPGDGMGARARKVPAKSIGSNPLLTVLPEKGTSSLATQGDSSQTTATTTNAPRAARYISPRVGSKDFAPSRLPEPKVKTVVAPQREGKFPPSPKVSDKVGGASAQAPSSTSAATNQPPAAAATPGP